MVNDNLKFLQSRITALYEGMGETLPLALVIVHDRNHLFGLGSDTKTETENWPKLLADTKTNRNHKI